MILQLMCKEYKKIKNKKKEDKKLRENQNKNELPLQAGYPKREIT
jgi:hypothetical protein